MATGNKKGEEYKANESLDKSLIDDSVRDNPSSKKVAGQESDGEESGEGGEIENSGNGEEKGTDECKSNSSSKHRDNEKGSGF